MILSIGASRLLGVAAFVTVIGGGIARAESGTPSLPLQGPIPFEVFDLDGSGAISQQEFDQVRARRTEAREKAGLTSMRGSLLFSSLDGDGNGAISREELQAAQGEGRGGQGRGPGRGGARGMGQGVSPPAFSDFDLNGDGAIDEPEFAEARAARATARASEGRMLRGMATAPAFADLDSDGDGILTPEEFASGVQRHWQRMGPGEPPGVEP